jgi:hypothetical protein
VVSLGRERMRIAGTDGAWHLLFGDLADVIEGVVELDFSACRQCRRVEMKLPFEVAPEDTPLFTDPPPESPLEPDAQAWNPLLGPPPADPR